MIGAGGRAAANAKECPQFVQHAASASAPPHLEQYKLVPRFFLTLLDDSPERHQILLSTNGMVNAPLVQRRGGKKFIALVPDHYC